MRYYYNKPTKAHQEWEWEKISLVTARKDYYECYECYGEIKKGTKYISDTFKYDGEYYKTNKICLKCWKGKIP